MSDIVIQGAREHNLKGIDVTIPRHTLTVMTGISGSGKSSLAFDTIFQEGQRRFLESLSAYTRQYLGNMSKPRLEHAEGLSPTVAIDQRSINRNPRSTVGTITEIYDYMRLLYARLGLAHCPRCSRQVSTQSPETIADAVLKRRSGKHVMVMAPIVQERKGEYRKEIEQLRLQGYVRARIDGEVMRLDQQIMLSRYVRHTIEVIIDRLKMAKTVRSRLIQAVELAAERGDGTISFLADNAKSPDIYSVRRACPECEINIPEFEPRFFSFNSPVGACEECRGLGMIQRVEPDLVIPDKTQSIRNGAIAPMKNGRIPFGNFGLAQIKQMAKVYGFRMDVPWNKLSKQHQKLILYGSGEERIEFHWTWREGDDAFRSKEKRKIKGVIPAVRMVVKMTSGHILKHYVVEGPCPSCNGKRLSPLSLAVEFQGITIDRMSAMTVQETLAYFKKLKSIRKDAAVLRPIIKEILARLEFLQGVGLGYLSLDRRASTLAGGEAQRIRLARQIGAGLQGVIYVLDEPSIGLHSRDNGRLLSILRKLRDHGNTVIVVEHDEETIRAADHLIDIGPGAGADGGHIVTTGTAARISRHRDSITGRYLSGKASIPVPRKRRPKAAHHLVLTGASEHNLKNIDLRLPLGWLVVVTGVSGSGKSTLVDITLRRALVRKMNNTGEMPGAFNKLKGAKYLDKVIEVDQRPIGRTPRSNPATYTKLMDRLRDLFSALPESKIRGYSKSRFSFNVRGGRCEDCEGAGVKEIEMQFLANVQIPCETCIGRRYNAETLAVAFKGKSISDVLEMTVTQALAFFENQPRIRKILKTMHEVGLGYVHLGQPSSTLSGGEAQRVKLATELHKPATGHTLYILDEPTTGLHAADVHRLVQCLDRLVDKGNTVVLVEHNLDVIKVADHVIDLGPEGGDEGGWIVAEGSPEEVARNEASHTGVALASVLNENPDKPSTRRARRKRTTPPEAIEVEGANKHNLKDVEVKIPHRAISVITGVSGSGKTTLAFDTIFSEGQRRFVESMSTYARRFLGRMDQGEVRTIRGLAPAIAIKQKPPPRNPRSTVATATEIYDYLRLLYARAGSPHCPTCGQGLVSHSPSTAWRALMDTHGESRVLVLAPVAQVGMEQPNEKGVQIFQETLMQDGFVRVWYNGKTMRLDDPDVDLVAHWEDLHLVITRLEVTSRNREPGVQAFELAFEKGRGRVCVVDEDGGKIADFFEQPACPGCGWVLRIQLSPRMFSFNSHVGACPQCSGLGRTRQVDPERLIDNPAKPLLTGALHGKVGRYISRGGSHYRSVLKTIAREEGFSIRKAYAKLTPRQQKLILYGNNKEYQVVQRRSTSLTKSYRRFSSKWEGLLNVIQSWYEKSDMGEWSTSIEEVMTSRKCSHCEGHRLRPESLAVRIGNKGIDEVCGMSVAEAHQWFEGLTLEGEAAKIAEQVFHEIRNRLRFLVDVGLGYLTLSRTSSTLSGGESQRMYMATQLGNRLVGVIYVLDEPTVGLHPVDVARLLESLKQLRDLGNTVVMVEHDRDVITFADHIVDLGPGAGHAGGEVIVSGDLAALKRSRRSLTGRYISGKKSIDPPVCPRVNGSKLTLCGASANNLRDLEVSFPLGTLIAVTGVSGSGKSSLIFESLLPALRGDRSGTWRSITGRKAVSRILTVDQGPIGRTPLSNPATYTKVFDLIREVFAKTPEARARGYSKARFSFNQSSGRCWACEGMGMIKVEMHFLADVWITCEECQGKRYNSETLAIQYRGKTIADILQMEVGEALDFFKHHPKIVRILNVLSDVGLGYMRLGQPATTLSGGEAQRVKLAAELARRTTGSTLFLLDEPTVGLHMEDVARLIKILDALVDQGGTVLVIEHNLDVIKSADYVVDLGPSGGESGGRIMVQGPPQKIAECAKSMTGKALLGLNGKSTGKKSNTKKRAYKRKK